MLQEFDPGATQAGISAAAAQQLPCDVDVYQFLKFIIVSSLKAISDGFLSLLEKSIQLIDKCIKAYDERCNGPLFTIGATALLVAAVSFAIGSHGLVSGFLLFAALASFTASRYVGPEQQKSSAPSPSGN
jgi:hypothetical protein